MPPIRPRSLNCTQCGSPITIKNGFKAKTVTCPACGSLLDVTSPKYSVLTQFVPGKYPPTGYLCVGMKGMMVDVAIEVIGRIRLKGKEYDDEDGWEYWYWDEWLILSEKGNYYWIEQDEGKYSIYEVLNPKSPPTRDDLQRRKFQLDEKSYWVKDKGEGEIIYIEGEMTWTVRYGDTLNYLEAHGDKRAIAIEWTDSEIEFFESRRLPERGLFDLFQMEEHQRILEKFGETHAENRAFSKRLFSSLSIFVFFGFLTMCLGMCQEGMNERVADGTINLPSPASEAAVSAPFEIASASSSYQIRARFTMVPPVDSVSLSLVNSQGKEYPIVEARLDGPGWGSTSQTVYFTPDQAGTWTVVAKRTENGKPRVSAPSGYRLVPAPQKVSAVKWTVEERAVAGELSCLWGILIVIAGMVFFVPFFLFNMYRRLRGPNRTKLMRAATEAYHQGVRLGGAT